jgi:hypothetical protein
MALTCAVGIGCAPSISDDDEGKSGATTATDGTTDGTTSTTSGTTVPGPEEPYQLFINEVMASNSMVSVDPDDDSATPDWVELHNPSEFDVDLSGWTVTDDLDDIEKHTLEDLSLPAGGFLVLVADDTTGGVHLPFKLSAELDAFGLFDPDGVPADRVEFASLDDNQVAGRFPDDGPLALLSEATPGATNDTAEVLEP